MEARPYVLLRDSDRATLRARLAAALSAWCREWLPTGAEATLESCRVLERPGELADELGGGDCWRAESAGGDSAFVLVAAPGRFVDALLGSPEPAAPEPDGLERALLDRAVSDLLRGLIGAPGDDTTLRTAEPAEAEAAMSRELGPGAPGACAQAAVGGVELRLLLSPGLVRGLSERVPAAPAAATNGLDGRLEALATIDDSRLPATARLGEIELTVAELASLRVGDVVCLDTRTDEPVKLELAGSGMVLDASLGTVQGQPALQIRGLAAKREHRQLAEGR